MNLVQKYATYSALILSLVSYIALGYFIERKDFTLLFVFYTIAFLCFIYLYKNNFLSEKQLFKIGILFRVIFVFGIPFWSQDFYRFIWDGNLILQNFNPFTAKPDAILNLVSFANKQELYQKMGSLSASHYSNYPPINQLLFAIASFFGGKSIFITAFILKLFILFSDIGIVYYGKKIVAFLNQNPKKIFLYFLNPLVIIELTGNLHFEGVMLFFFVVGLYFFLREKRVFSAIFIALSIATKLLPLLLLPFFYQKLGFKKSVYFYLLVIVLLLVAFLPFLATNFFANYSQTIALWFTNFEFNASFYYIAREIGYAIKGYNVIHTIGKYTPYISVFIFILFGLLKSNKNHEGLFKNALLALTIYFFIATTVHPWYVVNVLFLSIFTRFRFALLWTYLIILSYYAYSQNQFKENYFLLVIEYGLLFGYLVHELFFNPKKSSIDGK